MLFNTLNYLKAPSALLDEHLALVYDKIAKEEASSLRWGFLKAKLLSLALPLSSLPPALEALPLEEQASVDFHQFRLIAGYVILCRELEVALSSNFDGLCLEDIETAVPSRRSPLLLVADRLVSKGKCLSKENIVEEVVYFANQGMLG